MTFGRKVVAPSKNREPITARQTKADDVAPSEPELDLNRASLAIDNRVLMVLGPEGDPVPPDTVCALAADQPESSLAFDDGTKVPVGRVAKVLEAQAGGRLAPAGDETDRWLEAMLGLEAAPAMTSEEELEAERDDLEVTLFGNELVVNTAAGSSFVVTAAGPGGTEPAAARLALGDGTPLGLDDLLTRLRRAVGCDVTEPADELALPGCCFARDGEALELTTARGETFVLTAIDGGAAEGVALYTPDGESATFAELADALGLGDAGPEPVAASAAVDADAEQGDHARQPAQTTALADCGAAVPESAARFEADVGADEPQTGPEQAQAEVRVEPPSPVRVEETDDLEDDAGDTDDDQPILGEDAPAPPDAGAAADSGVSMEAEQDAPGDVPVNQPPRTTIPLACRLDDPSNVAIVLISGVPAGAVLSAGSDNGHGSWMVSPDQLDALAITLPGDAPGSLMLEMRVVTIDDRDGAMSTVGRDVVVAPEAGDSAAPATGPEAGIRLDLDALIHDAASDGPVSAVVVGGLPPDAELSAGLFDEGLRSWVVRPGELDDLRLLPGASANGPFELRVTVVTMDQNAGKPSATTCSIEVGAPPSPTVDLAADRPAERVGGVGFFRPLYDRRG